MSRNKLGEVRRSAAASLFGPGAVIDFRAGDAPISAVAAGLEEWDRNFPPAGMRNEQTVLEVRLQKKLRVQGFRLPPVSTDEFDRSDSKALVAVRFPNWLQCPQCSRLGESRAWSDETGQAGLYCAQCTQRAPGRRKVWVVPIRFVMACEAGHLDEFPWHSWVRHNEGCQRRTFLSLVSERAGLAGLILSCPNCNARRSMDRVFSEETWETFPNCRGRRPWLSGADETCRHKARAVQRGASNLYFPVIESALSIPPWSDQIQEAMGVMWDQFMNVEDPDERAIYVRILAKNELKPVLAELGMTPEAFAEHLNLRLNSQERIDTDNLRGEEHRQFTSGVADHGPDREFEMRPQTVPAAVAEWFSHLVRVVRLREVSALKGFTRIHPPGDPDSPNIAPISSRRLDWLPAIEVRGEGIYLELSSDALAHWEARDSVIQRIAVLDERHKAAWRKRFGEDVAPSPVTPRQVLVHTLAHALMRQLTLDCGYSSTALRERLYVDQGEASMAGLLIYTATTDDDGTLGGLQREGSPDRMERTIKAAIQAQAWCSSDPLCIEDLLVGENGMSLAACHACVLAPETSCETFNNFLDRALLVGSPQDPSLGFFHSLVSEND
ncbi:hypothetical protein GPNADHDJ_03038 [Stenotrophomonas maltophilia]|uniref:MrfA-like Zn-binding domain-containing protein n=1 Tax=Stenotrophomonas maltophilia TaxID=40324 RepID=A0AAX1IH84_STEMA|nr:DUF1998 domain-containing protein [Stenotrophomonas maltophilia]QGL78875.1 DUF1998 domain-containing protein [Stenotrophomonas maltophilia]QNG78818.1 hypothetical protein GPNADHDJ_03038 [Stenotrophomonas maltophilia]